MVDLDYRILKEIGKCGSCSEQHLIKKFGKNAGLIINDLMYSRDTDFITRETTAEDEAERSSGNCSSLGSGNISLTDDGKVFVERFKYQVKLTHKEQWKERILGFLSGVLTAVVATAVTSYCLPELLSQLSEWFQQLRQ